MEDFYCPECNAKPEINYALMTRKWSVRNLSVPYFLCVHCRCCGFDKKLIKNHIIFWRNSDNTTFGAKKYRIEEIYKEVEIFLEEIMTYFTKRIDYREVFFKHKPQP